MAVLPIRLFPDPVLRERAAEVTAFDDTVRKLIRDLEDTMRDAPGIGLAAPQVGVLRRVVVYDYGEGLRALVNPQILQRQGEVTDQEACLSIPGLAFPVTRAQRVVVRGLDAEGAEVTYAAEDLHARVIQHEVDHLDGVLYIDRLEPSLRREALRRLRERELGAAALPAQAPSL